MNNEPEGQTPAEGSTSEASGEGPGPGQVMVTKDGESHIEDAPAVPLGTAVPAVLDDPPAVATGRDHAEGVPQRGIAANPNPKASSGLDAQTIAVIAYDAVQTYKVEALGQVGHPYQMLNQDAQAGIVGQVVLILEGRSTGAGSNHDLYMANLKARGVTTEEDPRVDLPWLGMKPTESRKALLFNQVCVALIRTI